MTYCAGCGLSLETVLETHHVDEQRGNNDPDNLSPRCRRCHHNRTHDNPRRTDNYSTERYGPPRPTLSPPTP